MAAHRFATRMVSWQRTHGRHGLPWQHTQDPYRVWLSEIMLQQTQVATVIDYYARFLEKFPTVIDLANADIDEVLALWAGLGYYARARHLHACAKSVATHWQGQFPPNSTALQTLPGIGPSTAAAIAAFCYGERAAILDGNVKRVLARHFGVETDISQAATVKTLWAIAQREVPSLALTSREPDAMARYTQGMMDLGATVCTRHQPKCAACPVRSSCVALKQDAVERLPLKAKKSRDKPTREVDLLWLTCQESVLLEKRPSAGVWGSLWCLPTDTGLAARWGLGEPLAMASFAHELTHFTMRITAWRLQLTVRDRPLAKLTTAQRWVAIDELDSYGLPKPVRTLLAPTPPA
jgi:A/G-specific adenine glycosylase